MTESRYVEHTTELGCTLKVVDAPLHLGDGVILRGQMKQPDDGRTFEVYLSQEDLHWLAQQLLIKLKIEGSN